MDDAPIRDARMRAHKAARLSRRAGLASLGVLMVLGYFGWGLDLNFAIAVGVTWLAYYFVRFTRKDEGQVADSDLGLLVLGALMVIFAWGRAYSGGDVKHLLNRIERTCNGVEARTSFQAGACKTILEDIHAYQEPPDTGEQ